MVTTRLPTRRPRPTLLQRRIVRAFMRDQGRLIPLFRADLVRRFNALGELGRRAYRSLTPRPVRQIDPTDADLVDAISRSMFSRDPLAHFETSYRTAYVRTLEATAGTVGQTMGIAVGVPDPVARRVVAEGGRRLGLVDLRGQSRTALFHALSEGRAQGLTREALGAHIKDRIERGPYRSVQTRAQVISRTETAHAQRVSASETYKRIPVVTGMLAFDAQVGVTDADCEERDGLVYSFRDADIETSLEHPNGTLSWAPHIDR